MADTNMANSPIESEPVDIASQADLLTQFEQGSLEFTSINDINNMLEYLIDNLPELRKGYNGDFNNSRIKKEWELEELARSYVALLEEKRA